MTIKGLRGLREVLRQWDSELRSRTLCPKCGRPVSGLVLGSGLPTRERMKAEGLCVCEPESRKEV